MMWHGKTRRLFLPRDALKGYWLNRMPAYLLELVRYVVLNPIRAKMAKTISL